MVCPGRQSLIVCTMHAHKLGSGNASTATAKSNYRYNWLQQGSYESLMPLRLTEG